MSAGGGDANATAGVGGGPGTERDSDPGRAAARTSDEADEAAGRRGADAEPTAAPPVLSVALALTFGALAVLFMAVGSLFGAAAGTVGVALLGLSLAAASRRLASVAAGAFALAVIAGGATGASAGPLVASAVVAVAAWDVTDHGVGLGRQVGREAATARNELVHAGVSLTVGGVSGAVTFGVYLAAAGQQPVAALVFLLFGGVLLLAALRR